MVSLSDLRPRDSLRPAPWFRPARSTASAATSAATRHLGSSLDSRHELLEHGLTQTLFCIAAAPARTRTSTPAVNRLSSRHSSPPKSLGGQPMLVGRSVGRHSGRHTSTRTGRKPTPHPETPSTTHNDGSNPSPTSPNASHPHPERPPTTQHTHQRPLPPHCTLLTLPAPEPAAHLHRPPLISTPHSAPPLQYCLTRQYTR